jgi:hypothetical protein
MRFYKLLDRKGLTGWVYLSVRLPHLYCSMCKAICPKEKGNTGNQPERELEAIAKQPIRTSIYILSTYCEAQLT